MQETNWNKINQFLLIAFGIAWVSAYYMRFSQIPYGSNESITILAFLYMPAPFIAAYITQRAIHNESLLNFGLTIKGVSWLWTLLYTPLLFFVFFLGTFLAIYVLGNNFQIQQFGHLDFSNEHFFDFMRKALEEQKNEKLFPLDRLEQMPVSFAPLVLIAGLFVAFIAGYSINLPFTLGEELGWRGLLQEETRHWGYWKSNLFIGSIWGLWHAPIIMLGHNYPNYPIVGIGMMVLLCVSLSFTLSYIRYKTRTVFGPAAFHGMLNSSAGIAVMLIVAPNELVGSIAGIAGVIGALFILAYILIFDRKFITYYSVNTSSGTPIPPPPPSV